MAHNDEGLIPYQQWMNDALISVARKTILYIIRHGLSQGHQLYITFHTSYPGVAMSASLKKRYPERMTILLQHHFRNLKSDAVSFSVTLAFSGIEQRLRIPYLALYSMQDPSVNMTLHFNSDTGTGTGTKTSQATETPKPTPPLKSRQAHNTCRHHPSAQNDKDKQEKRATNKKHQQPHRLQRQKQPPRPSNVNPPNVNKLT